jgi:TonB family protein
MSIWRIWLTALVTILVLSPGRQRVSADQDNKDEPPKVEGAIVTSFVEVSYPPLARMARIQGPVVVRVTLDDAGKVVTADVIIGHPLLVRAVLPNARKWRFRPSRTKTALIFYDFQLVEGACGDSRSQLFVFWSSTATVTSCPLPAQPISK